MKAGIYARVSTHDQHTLDMQIDAMKKYAKARDWHIESEISEIGSGAKDRPKRSELLNQAKRRQIDVIIVWKLDRWGRSVNDLFHTLNELNGLGVGFISLTEALDLTTVTGRAMAGLLAIFAEFEREILRERVKAGIAHARSKGKEHGRPATAKKFSDEVIALFKSGSSQSEIARKIGIGRTSVRRIMDQYKEEIKLLNNTDVEVCREVNFLPCTDHSLRLIPIRDFEIQKLINIVPPENHDHGQKRYIITGGPGAGKTTIINELSKKYTVIPEAATTIIEKEIAQGVTKPWRFDDYHIKVNKLNNANYIKAQNLSVPIVFFDRGFLDSLSYILLQQRILHQYVIDCVQAVVNTSYFEKKVFFIDNLEYVVPGPARNESLEESLQKAACLKKNYSTLGYEIINVPPGSVEERVALITKFIALS